MGTKSFPAISLVIMTSVKPRHKYFANTLGGYFDVRGVVSEAKRPRPAGEAPEEDALIREHFLGWNSAEAKYFGKHDRFTLPEDDVLTVQRGESNNPEVFEWISRRDPKFIILFGTSIIRDPILGAFEGRVINMHLGLSPYYRGTATNFWPLVFNEPECVGVTIHIATPEVDGGPILRQARPEIALSDNSHDIGCKTIIRGAELMAGIIADYEQERIKPVAQVSGGKLFRQRDFNAGAVLAMRENFAKGMIAQYLADKERRDARFPIIA